MNNKGFTLVELLATLVILSIVVGISIAVINFDFDNAKEKTEEVFVGTVKDALDVYLSSSNDMKNLVFVQDTKNDGTACTITKKRGNVKVYKATTKRENDGTETDLTFNDVINSQYKPISDDDLVNPADEDVSCDVNAKITIYRDEDYIYYYSVDKSELGCLMNTSSKLKETLEDGTEIYYSDVITNLPEGYDCG